MSSLFLGYFIQLRSKNLIRLWRLRLSVDNLHNTTAVDRTIKLDGSTTLAPPISLCTVVGHEMVQAALRKSRAGSGTGRTASLHQATMPNTIQHATQLFRLLNNMSTARAHYPYFRASFANTFYWIFVIFSSSN